MPKRLIDAAKAVSAQVPQPIVPAQDVEASPGIRAFLHSEISPHFSVPRELLVGLAATRKG